MDRILELERMEMHNKAIKEVGLILLKTYRHGKSLYLCTKCNNTMLVKRKSLVKTPVCRNCSMGASFGEDAAMAILKKHNISFEKEKRFPGLKGSNNGSLRFDFYIHGKTRDFIIEIDGEQHYKESAFGGNTKAHDMVKDEFCLKNNIKIYRLKYVYGKLSTLEKEIENILISECAITV